MLQAQNQGWYNQRGAGGGGGEEEREKRGYQEKEGEKTEKEMKEKRLSVSLWTGLVCLQRVNEQN